MQIVRYRNSSDIDVQFLDDYKFIRKHTNYNSFRLGQIKNPYDKTLLNVGYMGVGEHKLHNDDLSETSAYDAWRNMIFRCYRKKERAPAYFDRVTVCEEWQNFQNFASWYEENYYETEGRLHLDKDILYPGNIIYSPEKCLLVPQRINMLFVNLPNKHGLPNGIRRTETTNKYSATYNGKSLGVYNTLYAAYEVYSNKKEKVIQEIANEYKKIIPEKLYVALFNYKVRIENDRNYDPNNLKTRS